MRTVRRVLLLLFTMGDIAAVCLLPQCWSPGLLESLRNSGWAGILAYTSACFVTTVLMVPPSIGNAGAGLMFGALKGTLFIYPALVGAGVVSFCLSRKLGRRWVAVRIARSPKFAAIDRALARGGLKMVLLLRVSPISPFAFLSYSMGLTRVRFRDYCLGTLLGALPGTAVYAYLGSALRNLPALGVKASAAASSDLHRLLFWIGLAATIAAFVMITRLARQELKRTMGETLAAHTAG